MNHTTQTPKIMIKEIGTFSDDFDSLVVLGDLNGAAKHSVKTNQMPKMTAIAIQPSGVQNSTTGAMINDTKKYQIKLPICGTPSLGDSGCSCNQSRH